MTSYLWLMPERGVKESLDWGEVVQPDFVFRINAALYWHRALLTRSL